MLFWKLNVLEIPLDKGLTANWLLDICTKLEELIPAGIVKYGLNRLHLLSLLNCFFRGSLFWAVVVSKHVYL